MACSPIGMKKPFRTFVDESAILLERMSLSAGKIGAQIETAPDNLIQIVSAEYADLTKRKMINTSKYCRKYIKKQGYQF